MLTKKTRSDCRILCAGWGDDIAKLKQCFSEFDSCACDIIECQGYATRDDLIKNDPDVYLIRYESASPMDISILENLQGKGLDRSTEIILYAPNQSEEIITQCLEREIRHVVTKPMGFNALAMMAIAARENHVQMKKLQAEVSQRRSAIGYILAGEFEVKTLDEARNLSTMLSLACPDPSAAALGLFEFIANGVEHGNYEIGYDLKSELIDQNRYAATLKERSLDPKYKDKSVRVKFKRTKDFLIFSVADEGKGFEPTPFMKFDPARLMDTHGRGIAMAVNTCFQSVEYNAIGNEVTCKFAVA